MKGPGPQTFKYQSPARRHHPIARTIYLALGLISILLVVLFGWFTLIVFFTRGMHHRNACIFDVTSVYVLFLAGIVFFGLVAFRLIKLGLNLRAKAGGVLLWLSGVVLALSTTEYFVEGPAPDVRAISGVVLPIIGISVLCLWWSNKEPRK